MKRYMLSLTCILCASCGRDVHTRAPKQHLSRTSIVYVSMGDIQIPVCDERYTTAAENTSSMDDTLQCKK